MLSLVVHLIVYSVYRFGFFDNVNIFLKDLFNKKLIR